MPPARLTLCAAFLALAAAAPEDNGKIIVMGRGLGSCASWLKAPEDFHSEGNQWILGFVTGANAIWGGNVQAGKQTDVEGVLGEVELICKADPSRNLADAVNDVWKKLEHDGR
jgi:hypothetical protein